MRAALVVLACCILAPSAAALPTTLYAHLMGLQDFPLNTQEPDPSYSWDGTTAISPTLTCLPETPGASLRADWHTFYGYVTPSLVDYSAVGANGLPRIHPERGLSRDIHLDPAVPALFHWYWSAASPPAIPSQSPPAPIPNVVVRVTMRAGDSISVNNKAYDTGPELASGESVPALLAGDLSQGVEHDVVDGRVVYHFVVPLKIEATILPAATGFNVRVDTFVNSPVCNGDGMVMPSTVALHSSPGHRPRLELGLADQLAVESMHPVQLAHDFVLHVALSDPWGAYDVKHSELSIAGPGLAPTPLQLIAAPARTHCHCYGPNSPQFQAMDQAWVLNGMGHLAAGNYTAHLSATTLEGVTQMWDLPFSVGGQQAAPAPALPVALLAFALALVLRRRTGPPDP